MTSRNIEDVEARYFWLHFFYGAIFLIMLVTVLWFSVTIDAKLRVIGDTATSTYGLGNRLTVVENKLNLIDKSLQKAPPEKQKGE